ncbi:hypothetical protein [Streptomyces sp. SLBN-115]|uniref:hypothetical protein n=1 Tax=Streptomyces sp. SLBN-115 TaxID=2768453 RepID=UPI00116EC1AD|nr:hypothetical protein [Streptomyces sp. SLBN-115]TQJ36862.1 hypothetical protein FBY34_8815 [Streptomyces sp. SLBN-115]
MQAIVSVSVSAVITAVATVAAAWISRRGLPTRRDQEERRASTGETTASASERE